jgi:CRISPR-associated protein (TIGR02710 family)
MTDGTTPPLILALTVGGSRAPLQTAIEETTPDLLLLIASAAGAGSVSSNSEAEAFKAEFAASRAGRHADIVEVPADDPDRGFSLILAKIDALRKKHGVGRFVADYTGGTKSMSAALLMAAFQRDLETRITTGRRDDLVKVTAGTQTARKIDVRLIGVERDLATALRIASKGDYAAAADLIGVLRRRVQQERLAASKAFNTRLERAGEWARLFAAWDRFDHREAWKIYRAAWEDGRQWVTALDESGHAAVLEDLAQGKDEPRLSLCQDLLENARRRNRQGRFDDAVARLYRFTEACVQTQLYRRYKLKSGQLSASDLPPELLEEARPSYDPRLKRAVCKLGLMQTVKLLKLRDPDDPLAAAFGESAPPWQGARNNSILAHGYTAVDPRAVKEAFAWVEARSIPAVGLTPMPPFPDQPNLG